MAITSILPSMPPVEVPRPVSPQAEVVTAQAAQTGPDAAMGQGDGTTTAGPRPGGAPEDARNGEGRDPGQATRKGTAGQKTGTGATGQKGPGGQELTPEELKQLQQLKQRDREVRAHEQAHIAAGGRYVRGGASFDYQKGPDGKRYAIGGEVSIDTSPEQDPEATIRKMETVRKAALAPAQPSSQDRSVAAKAAAKAAEARAELAKEKMEGDGDDKGISGKESGATEASEGAKHETAEGEGARDGMRQTRQASSYEKIQQKAVPLAPPGATIDLMA